MTRPATHDGIPVAHTFYARPVRRAWDLVPAMGDAVVRLIERHPEFLETDVVYAHWLWTGGAVGMRLRSRFGWPVAAIARGSDMHYWQDAHPHCRPYVERVLREADLVMANCHGLRRIADTMTPGAAGRIEVVYNGCDADLFRPADDRAAVRRALGLPVNGQLLLCCASLIDRKGIAELAQAWRVFAPRHPAWSLLVLGRRGQPRLIDDLYRDSAGRVRVLGPVSGDRVAEFMRAADAYVQPSRLEGLANATMEAMATALPVVATDTGGQNEAVHDGANGWLVPPGNPAALAGALHAMASDPIEARTRGSAARATIIDRFDPIAQAVRLYGLLDGLRIDVHSSRSSPAAGTDGGLTRPVTGASRP